MANIQPRDSDEVAGDHLASLSPASSPGHWRWPHSVRLRPTTEPSTLSRTLMRLAPTAHQLFNTCVRWLAAHATQPAWLPSRWRSPWISYSLAALATLATGELLSIVSVSTSGRVQLASPLLLITVLLAFPFGPGPSLLSALLGTFLLDYFILPPHFTWAHTDPAKALTVAVFGLVGCGISLLASRAERARQRAEALAQALRSSEQELVRRMDEFLGVASHELKTPLTSLLANVQFVKRQLRAQLTNLHAAELDISELDRRMAQMAKLLAEAERQVRRQDRLVNDLLDISRARVATLALRLRHHNLAALVRRCVEEQRRTHPSRQINDHIDLPGEMQVAAIHVDEDRIGQVLNNLLSNALKYSGENEPVTVTLTLEEQQRHQGRASQPFARVAVRDKGPGLSPDEQARVWERLYRAPSIAVQSGAEIGLYISRELIEMHGGSVGVESAPGLGSTFWFTLPLASTAPDTTQIQDTH